MELTGSGPSLLAMTSATPMIRPLRTTAVLAALALSAAACGSDDSAAVEIDGAWARTSPMAAEAGVAYFQISSEEADVLIGASVDASVAGTVEIHETQMMEMMDDEAMDDMDDMDEMEMEDDVDMGDVMQMAEVGSIDLPAGETISLEPGGLHIMMLDLTEPLESGDTFELTLDFETAEDQVVTVAVGDSAPE